jgi:hypothetical protein
MVRSHTEWRTHWCHKEDDIRKVKNKKDGTDKCKIYRQDYTRRTFDYSLGGYYFQECWMQLLTGVMDAYSMTGYHSNILSWSMMDYIIFEPILEKVFFDYSLGGYSHRERWARTRRYFLASIGTCEEEECYSHRERVLWLFKPEYFQSKFDCNMRFSSCVITTKLECRDLSRR